MFRGEMFAWLMVEKEASFLDLTLCQWPTSAMTIVAAGLCCS
jgi:hypothetical protein